MLLAAELRQPPDNNEVGSGAFSTPGPVNSAPCRKTWDVLTIATSELFPADPWPWWVKQLWFGLFFMTELACVRV